MSKYLIWLPLVMSISGALLWSGSLQNQVGHNTEEIKELKVDNVRTEEKLDEVIRAVERVDESVDNLSNDFDRFEERLYEVIKEGK